MSSPFGKLLCAAALASAVIAQNITITIPAAGTHVSAGSSITVQLDIPAPLTSSEQVSVVIGTMPCPAGCPDVTQYLGNILYSGPYNPQSTNGTGDLYQNFTVTVPSWYNGPAQLGVAHFYLYGVYGSAALQFATTTLMVSGGSG